MFYMCAHIPGQLLLKMMRIYGFDELHHDQNNSMDKIISRDLWLSMPFLTIILNIITTFVLKACTAQQQHSHTRRNANHGSPNVPFPDVFFWHQCRKISIHSLEVWGEWCAKCHPFSLDLLTLGFKDEFVQIELRLKPFHFAIQNQTSQNLFHSNESVVWKC